MVFAPSMLMEFNKQDEVQDDKIDVGLCLIFLSVFLSTFSWVNVLFLILVTVLEFEKLRD